MLPRHHARWLGQLVGELELPAERRATCRDCAMCLPTAPTRYSSETKCCTFLPQLTNFLVGALIRERPALIEAGPRQLRTPAGMIARPGQQARYDAMVARDGFGREPAMRCPYYAEASGDCTIWSAREAQCSTWFCAHDHGERGRALWQAVLAWLRLVEAALARWCVVERGLSLALAGGDDAEAWGHWWGREGEFYLACADAVDGLDAGALARLLPPAQVELREALLRAHARLELVELASATS